MLKQLVGVMGLTVVLAGCSQGGSSTALPTAPKASSAEELAKLKKDYEARSGIAVQRQLRGMQPEKSMKEQFAEHQPFDFNFELPDLEGNQVSLADYKGKVVIVDFWGTWCPPCKMEIPHFVELLKKHHDEGLDVVGINYENGPEGDQAIETIKKFKAKNVVPYPCLIGDQGTQSRVPNFNAFPTTLFVDREGRVRLKLVGYRPMELLEEAVSTLLAENKPAPAAN